MRDGGGISWCDRTINETARRPAASSKAKADAVAQREEAGRERRARRHAHRRRREGGIELAGERDLYALVDFDVEAERELDERHDRLQAHARLGAAGRR